jgi:hypothetical protein
MIRKNFAVLPSPLVVTASDNTEAIPPVREIAWNCVPKLIMHTLGGSPVKIQGQFTPFGGWRESYQLSPSHRPIQGGS